MNIKTLTYGKNSFPVKFICLDMNFSCMETSVCPKSSIFICWKIENESNFREFVD